MLYLGIDQHARQITISLRDDSGDVLQARQVSTRLFEHKESESHQLKGQLRQYERERSEIREKLGKILGQLEQLDLS